MANLGKLLTDKNAEMNGAPFKFPETDIVFKIRRINYKPYQRAIEEVRRELVEKYASYDDSGDAVTNALNRAEVEAKVIREHADEFNVACAREVGRHLLTGWDNLTERVDGNEQPIVFSTECAIELCTKSGAEDFIMWVLGKAEKQRNFKQREAASLKGN